jgi:hypothetical protein
MAPVTEAACLLDSGVLYGSRVLLRPATGDPVFAGFKAGVFSLYHGDAPVYHFDLEGRWQKVFDSGRHYLKALDTTVRAVDRSRDATGLTLTRRTLNFAESSDVDAAVRSAVLDLVADLDAGRFERLDPPATARPLSTDELRTFLETAVRWDAAAWFAHRERYLDTYGPLPLVPPDCTAPLLLQATLGDDSGRTFGGGRAAGFYARSPQEFEPHARAVAALYGRRTAQCRQVLLAGADALRRPVDDVAAFLEVVGRLFPIDPGHGPRRPDPGDEARPRLDGVHALLDRFEPPLPTRDDWARLHALGLSRVSLGIESADPAVRGAYGKTWTNEALSGLVADLEASGIGVGLILLVGAGGIDHDDDRHAAATAALVDALPLGEGDLVSLLDASRINGPDTVIPLTVPARAARLADLRARLEPLKHRRNVRVAPCAIDKHGVL